MPNIWDTPKPHRTPSNGRFWGPRTGISMSRMFVLSFSSFVHQRYNTSQCLPVTIITTNISGFCIHDGKSLLRSPHSPVCLSKSNPGPCQSSGGPLVALCDLLGEPWWWIRAAKPRRVRTTCPESGPGRLNGCMGDRLNQWFTKFTRFPSQKIWGFVGIFYMKPQFPTLKKIEIERESPSKS